MSSTNPVLVAERAIRACFVFHGTTLLDPGTLSLEVEKRFPELVASDVMWALQRMEERGEIRVWAGKHQLLKGEGVAA